MTETRTASGNATSARAPGNAVALIPVLWLAACVAPTEPPSEPLSIPFDVSDHYSPDGFFGDGETRGYLDLARGCPDRPPGAHGDCVTITYKPGPKRFAGIVWQHPHNNWGYWRGHDVAPGATRILFSGRGSRGTESLTASAGLKGMNERNDSFTLEPKQVALGTTWQSFEAPFFGANYQGKDGVLAAFSVSLTASDNDETTVLYLDDIRWVK